VAEPSPVDGVVTLAQLTDTHLFADDTARLKGLETDRLLTQALAHLASAEPPELLVLTGDLVHDGSAAGYRRLAAHLREYGLRACALPGNHDDPQAMRRILPEEGIACGPIVRIGRWRLVLLDTHRPGTDAGELGEAQIALLADQLEREDGHVLVALHHHPLPVGSRWIDALGLWDRDRLWSAIGDHPRLRGVVCGHVHQAFAATRGRVPVWASPATCMQFAPGRDEFALDDAPPGYRRLRLHPDGTVQTEVVRLPAV
jgi:Icc protein